MEIIDFKEIDVSKIFLKNINRSFTKPLYFGKNITIMTPIMSCAFGVEKEYSNYLMKMRFNSSVENHCEFFDFIKNLEDFFNETLKRNKFKSQIRINKRYSPLLILKLPFKDGKFLIDVEDNNLTTIFDIVKDMKFKCVLELNNIWHNDVSVSYKWNVKKIVF
tara:strand:+ start:3840 stop:4328 length:489 start_codon:yes stop_codon:yes gene_type:complete